MFGLGLGRIRVAPSNTHHWLQNEHVRLQTAVWPWWFWCKEMFEHFYTLALCWKLDSKYKWPEKLLLSNRFIIFYLLQGIWCKSLGLDGYRHPGLNSYCSILARKNVIFLSWSFLQRCLFCALQINIVQLSCKSAVLTPTFELSSGIQTGNKNSVTVFCWYTLLLNMLESFIKLFKASHKVAKTKLINSKIL